MKRRLVSFGSIILLTLVVAATTAASNGSQDSDLRLVDAEVVEATEMRLSVIARTGVEHVIAIDRADTRVIINGRQVAISEVRVGDIVTVELYANREVKFARRIQIAPAVNGEVARARP